ncbi:somatostatin receptor type 2-like [Anneissia japonica]|uniref:somatostatin receptor type 2-like n=1 Tax=Anneissia japonica TaxID=1529436 RepID=UPI00142570E2|nr:somatostatin receptor type 2-like [Anneissia japonica]XP_033098594.1 somatostatin receptor type 2-like [Anneissia japonica]
MALTTDNISANGTNGDLYDIFYIRWTYFLFTICIFIAAVGVFGNGLVIYVILRFARMQTVTNCYILNLAIADEIFVLVLPIFGVSLLKDAWEFGTVTCFIIMSIDIFNQFTSVYTLTAMSVDRYIAVCHPAQAGRYRRFPIVVGICIGIWIISVCSVLPMIIHIKHDTSGCYFDFTRFGNTETWTMAMYLYTLSLGLLIPLVVIMVSYILLLVRLKQVTARTGKSKKNRKVTNMVMIIVVVFVLCWSPFYILRAFIAFQYQSLTSDYKLFKILLDGTMILSYINSCANPILYGFLSDNFRKSYQHARPCAKNDQADISVNDSYIRKKYKSVTTCPRLRSRRGNRDELEDSAQRGNNYRLAPMTMMTSTTCAGSPYSRVPKEDI